MTKKYGLFSMLLVVIFSVSTLAAQGVVQTQTSPLLEMLARVPNTPTTREAEMYYLDKQAIEAAFPPAQMPASYAQWNTEENPAYEIWWRVVTNVGSGVGRMQTGFGFAEEMPATIGFEWFDVKREFQFGAPPTDAAILQGTFDLDAVRAAFGNEDAAGQSFEQIQSEPVELWCWVEGCDMGFQTNIRDRNLANVFGGDLGRRQPLVITEGDPLNVLFSSAAIEIAQDYIDVQTGDLGSLADLPRYSAAAQAVTQEGILIQALIMDTPFFLGQFGADPASMLLAISPNMTAEERAALLDRFITDQLDTFQALPQFELLLFADVVREDTQAALIALVYDDEASAQAATEVIPVRLDTASSLAVRRPWREILAEHLVLDIETSVIASEGKYVALIALPTTRVPGDQVIAETELATSDDTNNPDLAPPGLTYRLLVNAVFRRDLGWLDTTTRAQLEAMLSD